MYKVMTPSQLKEHNTMLLLLKQKEAQEKDKIRILYPYV